MDQSRAERLDLIRRAIREGELFLEYLPTVDLATGCCRGAEALVRWRHEGRVVPPMEFIPDIEFTPVAGLLTYWVIDQVGRELGDWLKHLRDEIHVAVNVPPELLGRGGIEYAGAKAHLTSIAHKFMIEVSERGLVDRLGVDALNYYGSHNVLIALDDVQLGEVRSLMLSRAKIDVIKLDRAVTQEVERADDEADAVRTLKALASVPGLTLIGEGIETESQADRLREIGIRWGQGYFFSRPIPAASFIAFFEKNRDA